MHGYTHLDVLLYLFKMLGGRVRGVKKLVKLVFLVDYERRGAEKTMLLYTYRGLPASRARFVIWDYGPFSRDVYDAMEEAEVLFEVTDPEPPVEISLTQRGKRAAEEAARRLPEPVKRRIEGVVSRYGVMSGGDLARVVYAMLGLDDILKEEYKGVSVERYLREMGFKLIPTEVS